MLDAQATAVVLTVCLIFALGAVLLLALAVALLRNDNTTLATAVLAHNDEHARQQIDQQIEWELTERDIERLTVSLMGRAAVRDAAARRLEAVR